MDTSEIESMTLAEQVAKLSMLASELRHHKRRYRKVTKAIATLNSEDMIMSMDTMGRVTKIKNSLTDVAWQSQNLIRQSEMLNGIFKDIATIKRVK